MNNEMHPHYYLVEKCIKLLSDQQINGLQLTDLSQILNVSPFHLQRVFSEWAGVSPKKFHQFIRLKQAKHLFQSSELSLFDASMEMGLSSTGRLHDLFVSIESMTPGEFKSDGRGVEVIYSVHSTVFGRALVASTPRGICYVGFLGLDESPKAHIQNVYSNSHCFEKEDQGHDDVFKVLNGQWPTEHRLHFSITGTSFQLKVWEALLKIPNGEVKSYGQLANEIEIEGGSRAVGNAVGKNPLAYIIPCHRVIRNTGILGNYRWDSSRKVAMLAKEYFSK